MSVDRVSRAREALLVALKSVEEEMAAAGAGSEVVDSIENLSAVAESLRAMHSSLSVEPIRLLESPGLWHNVIDTWPFGSPLRHAVVDAELQYERLGK